MPALKNAKHEYMAQGLARGLSATEAYIKAGYQDHDGNAARLSGNERIRARVAELQERKAVRAEITGADIAAQLQQDREFARSLGHSAAAVSASLGVAKVLGLVIEKREVSGPNGSAIKVDITRFSDAQLEQLESLLRSVADIGDDQGGEGEAQA